MGSMIKFNGRLDGLGNRIEELINIECYCIENDIKHFMETFYWTKN